VGVEELKTYIVTTLDVSNNLRFDLRRDLGYLAAVSITAATNEVDIWNRAIRPEVGDLSAAAARELLRLRLSDGDVERVQELSGKANSGVLTVEESRELDDYLNVGRALEFIKAKARLSLPDKTDHV
jgi:hypothetical protein